jgi:uncharacterized pyridoxamine 5'-phosphate oxidase family protein
MLNTFKHQTPTPVASEYSDRKQRIHDFLSQTAVGVLSTVNPDGEPHGVVIYFNINTDFGITFLTRAGTRKYDNLKHHNHLMLTVFDLRTQTTAQITGRAIEITDNYEVNQVAAGMLATSLKISEPGLPPITKLEAGDYVAFTIHPVQIRMAVYARPDPGEYTELFESIESFEFSQ